MNVKLLLKRYGKAIGLFCFAVGGWIPMVFMPTSADGSQTKIEPYVMIGYNDLGMHCMNQDFSELCILPPFNNLRAQIIRRGAEPQIVRSGFTVTYSILGNTYSVGKTNFWSHEDQLFGVNLPNNVGLTGNGLSGSMLANSTLNMYVATGIPATPIQDSGALNAYNMAQITARRGTTTLTTNTVVPVSWEISCNLCHVPTHGETVDTNILEAHDRLHGTDLVNHKPVLCAACHSDPALGTAGTPGVPSMSAAMHSAHANRMGQAGLANACYACHPGVQTDCQRDVHKANNILCVNCHGSMADVGASTRTPWVDEPKCGSCHNTPNHQYEEPGLNFKESRGHGGVNCTTCHNSPHVIAPSTNPADNQQMKRIQGHAGTLNKCEVCHIRRPNDSFFHRINE